MASGVKIPDEPKAASPEVVGFDVVIPAADRAIQPLKGVNGCMQRLSFIPRMFMV